MGFLFPFDGFYYGTGTLTDSERLLPVWVRPEGKRKVSVVPEAGTNPDIPTYSQRGLRW